MIKNGIYLSTKPLPALQTKTFHMASTSTSTAFEPEYLPIEFLLADMSDYNLTSWISDQVGCLHSVFKVYQCEERTTKEVIYVGETRIQVIRTDQNQFDVVSASAVNSVGHEGKAQCLHLKDGTVVVFICQNGGNLTGYHFCFEDIPEETFRAMVSTH